MFAVENLAAHEIALKLAAPDLYQLVQNTQMTKVILACEHVNCWPLPNSTTLGMHRGFSDARFTHPPLCSSSATPFLDLFPFFLVEIYSRFTLVLRHAWRDLLVSLVRKPSA